MLPPFIALLAITLTDETSTREYLDQFRRWRDAAQRNYSRNLGGSRKSGLRVVTAMVFPHFAVVLGHATLLPISCLLV